ncbi:MAG: PspC domain-containing protein [Rhodothermales bacterium]|nr:PspC domain-containing protein [Rhodothermales bacterium]
MKSRTRTSQREETPDFLFEEEDSFDLEALSDEELEDFLFEEEEKPSRGIFNLPTLAGLSLIMVGVAYIFQQAGLWSGFDLTQLALMLPWIAGVLIILLGFGVLNWRPRKKRKPVKKTVKKKAGKKKVVLEATETSKARPAKRKLEKSRNKKIFGVCAGIADYFGIDPTLVRIAFVVGTIATQGPFLLAYLVLAMVMPNPKGPTIEERITILKDSGP